MKYKVGDKVKCIKNEVCEGDLVGEIFIITEIRENNIYYPYYNADLDVNFGDEELELVQTSGEEKQNEK